MTDSKAHWENIYKTKSSKEVSWFKPHLDKSLELILGLSLPKDAQIMDIGGGASTLPDDLLANGYKNITVLDISSEALKVSKDRLGNKANSILWLEGDVTQASLKPDGFDLWHDRAVFHFLTSPDDRAKYIGVLKSSLKVGGNLIIATFNLNGPMKCSGLDIVRYSPQTLSKELGSAFKLIESFDETHKTPFNTVQNFVYCCFKKTAD